jgi:hypothetical protein
MNAYVNDEGDVWIPKGSGPWPKILREARGMLDMIADPGPMEYLGVTEVRVSDEHDADGLHHDDDGCADSQDTRLEAPGFVPCCRTEQGHHFRAKER